VDWAKNRAKFKYGSRTEFRDPFLRYTVSARQLRNPLRPRRDYPATHTCHESHAVLNNPWANPRPQSRSLLRERTSQPYP